MDQGSKAFPTSVRVVAHLMRPLLMEGMQMLLFLGLYWEVSSLFAFSCKWRALSPAEGGMIWDHARLFRAWKMPTYGRIGG